MRTSGPASGLTNIAASPIVLISRTGGSATDVASSRQPSRDAPELAQFDLAAEAREADEVGEADGELLTARDVARLELARARGCRG